MISIVWLLKNSENIVVEVKFKCTHPEREDLYLEYKVELPEPNGTPVPFSELTEEQIISWLENDMGILFEPIEEALQYQYEKIAANVEAELPWL